MDDVNVGDIIVVSRSGVQTYYEMVNKHLDGGGEFMVVVRDGSPHPHTLKTSVITYPELTSSEGYFVDHYIPY